jgi:hypothetical protein
MATCPSQCTLVPKSSSSLSKHIFNVFNSSCDGPVEYNCDTGPSPSTSYICPFPNAANVSLALQSAFEPFSITLGMAKTFQIPDPRKQKRLEIPLDSIPSTGSAGKNVSIKIEFEAGTPSARVQLDYAYGTRTLNFKFFRSDDAPQFMRLPLCGSDKSVSNTLKLYITVKPDEGGADLPPIRASLTVSGNTFPTVPLTLGTTYSPSEYTIYQYGGPKLDYLQTLITTATSPNFVSERFPFAAISDYCANAGDLGPGYTENVKPYCDIVDCTSMASSGNLYISTVANTFTATKVPPKTINAGDFFILDQSNASVLVSGSQLPLSVSVSLVQVGRFVSYASYAVVDGKPTSQDFSELRALGNSTFVMACAGKYVWSVRSSRSLTHY